MRRRNKGCLGLGVVVLALGAVGWVVYGGGEHEGPGTVTDRPLPPEQVAARDERRGAAAGPRDRRILFGDLHVHSTFSADAFMRSVPLLGGEGAHPPADACDFARYCSGLDFFSLTDHAEMLTPRHWKESIEAMRQCRDVGGDTDSPDVVPFMGFEWTQVGVTPEEHYGHKNVIFRGLGDEELPTRPIAAPGLIDRLDSMEPPGGSPIMPLLVPIFDFDDRQRYLDLAIFLREGVSVDACPEGVDARELPDDCRESAETPRMLFEKLAQWGLDTLVIPHGTTWGFYTPPGYTWDKQLDPTQDDPELQRLVEVYSGHGNSEEYDDFRAVEWNEDGEPICPEPTEGYVPCCWRAGEIIRERCGDDVSDEECERRVVEARRNHARMGVAGHLTVPGATTADWKDCGQCRDCFNPAFNYRPAASAQYMLARGHFEGEDDGQPRHAKMGFIASSDNHTARPGTGYKEYERRKMTEATGAISEEWRDRIFGEPEEPAPESRAMTREDVNDWPAYQVVNLERQASFFMTGGLVAVHAGGRDRDAIWDALQRREVYGTSGERILLFFDWLGEDGERRPMGSELETGRVPRFVVRAVGAFEQKPGCPKTTTESLSAERLAHLCAGECWNPSSERRRITQIEIVRIRPQQDADEPVAELIEDPWRTLPCPTDGSPCEVEVEDPEFVEQGRDVVYYARAIQEPTPAVNAGGVRCSYDAEGSCVEANPCYGDYRTGLDDDCLSDNAERAWSSPIFLRFDAQEAAEAAPDGGVAAPDGGTR